MCFGTVAQLGERKTEDLKVPGSIPGGLIHSHTQFRVSPSSNLGEQTSYVALSVVAAQHVVVVAPVAQLGRASDF